MGDLNSYPMVRNAVSRLTLADYEEVSQQSHARQTVRLDEHNMVKLNAGRDSLTTKLVRFFRSIAEGLRLSKPGSISKQQVLAAQQFQNLIRQSGYSDSGGRVKKTYRHADIIRFLDQTKLQGKKAAMDMRAACELVAPKKQVQDFAATVQQQSGHDVHHLLGLSPAMDQDDMAKTVMHSELWLKYQSHLDVIAKAQPQLMDKQSLAQARQADTERDAVAAAQSQLIDRQGLDHARHAAARLVVATASPQIQLDASSRAYRQSIHDLTSVLRQCGQSPQDVNIAGLVYRLKNCQNNLAAGLKGQSVSHQEQQMMFDIILNEALNGLSREEKSNFLNALRTSDSNLLVLIHSLDAGSAGDKAWANNFVRALQKNAQTFIYMPDLDHVELESSAATTTKMALAQQALSDYSSMQSSDLDQSHAVPPRATEQARASRAKSNIIRARVAEEQGAQRGQQAEQEQQAAAAGRSAATMPANMASAKRTSADAATMPGSRQAKAATMKAEAKKERIAQRRQQVQQAAKEKIADTIRDVREQIQTDRTLDRADRDKFLSELDAAQQQRQQKIDQFEKNVEDKAATLRKSHQRK